jgi:hypothetical protein
MEKYLRKGNASIISQRLAVPCSQAAAQKNSKLAVTPFKPKVVGRCEINSAPFTCANYRDKEGKEGRSRDSFVMLKLDTNYAVGQICSICQSESGISFTVRLFKRLCPDYERQDKFREMTQGRMWLVSSNFEENARAISQADVVRKVGIYPVQKDLWFPGEFLLIIDTDA